MAAKESKKSQEKDGQINVGGNISIKNGDFVAGDKVAGDKVAGNKNVDQSNRSVNITGNVSNSTIVTGDGNQVSNTITVRNELFEDVFKKIDERPDTSDDDKSDLKANVEEAKDEAEKGDDADETFLARRLRNIKRIAPDILEVVIATLTNPAAGFSTVVRKIAERAKASADGSEVSA